MTREELEAAFIAADEAGETEDAQAFAEALRQMDALTPATTALGQVPSGSEPLLYPNVPTQNRNEPTAGFNPDMAFQSLKDITRNMGNAVTLGGRDAIAPALGSGRTYEQELAETEAMKERLDPGVRVGTGVAADMLLPVGEVGGMLANIGKPAVPVIKKILPKGGWKAQVNKEAEVKAAVDKAKKLMASKRGKLTKDSATRQAFTELGANTQSKLTDAELKKLNQIIFGGPVRNTAEAVARKAPKFPGPIALATSAAAGEYGGFGGAKAAMVLGTLGLLSQGVRGGAKAITNQLASRDVKKLLETIKSGGG